MDVTVQALPIALLAGAEELAELAVVADQLGSIGLDAVERWQALDRMSQHLDGLAMFLAGLAAIVPNASLDLSGIVAGLKTAALADRLAGRACQSIADPGALELFDA